MIVHINAGQAALVRTMATSGARLEWGELIQRTAPDMHTDNFAPLLAERLAAMIRAGIDAHGLLTAAIASGTLPDDHAAAALWWRISRHLAGLPQMIGTRLPEYGR